MNCLFNILATLATNITINIKTCRGVAIEHIVANVADVANIIRIDVRQKRSQVEKINNKNKEKEYGLLMCNQVLSITE